MLNELETILIKNGVTPIYLFKNPRVLEYLTYYPLHHIYCFLTQQDINNYINRKERDFVKFIKRLGIIRRKKINLLLDSPSDYEYESPLSIGWKNNPRYEDELKNYRAKLKEYEQQKAIVAEKRKKLLKKPEAKTYLYVMNEFNAAKCPGCAGTGIIPTITKSAGYCCFRCHGTGRSEYRPKVTAELVRVAKEFKERLDSLKEPTFSAFPRKKKSIYIRVIHGGQIFISEK